MDIIGFERETSRLCGQHPAFAPLKRRESFMFRKEILYPPSSTQMRPLGGLTSRGMVVGVSAVANRRICSSRSERVTKASLPCSALVRLSHGLEGKPCARASCPLVDVSRRHALSVSSSSSHYAFSPPQFSSLLLLSLLPERCITTLFGVCASETFLFSL